MLNYDSLDDLALILQFDSLNYASGLLLLQLINNVILLYDLKVKSIYCYVT